MAPRDHVRQAWSLAAVLTATFMLLLDISAVNTALPAMRRGLGAGFSDLQWVLDAYTVPLAAVVLSAGSLADRLGRKRVFLAGLAIFTTASLACGASPSAGSLIAARAVQGIGAAVVFALSLALVAQLFPAGPGRGRAMAAFGATIGVAIAIGPLVGGVITTTLGWRYVFFLNLPLGVAAAGITLACVTESKDPQPKKIDWAGLLTLSGGLFAVVLALLRGNANGWGSPTILGLLSVAGALLIAFAVIQLRGSEPMLPLELFRGRAFTGVQVAAFTVSASMFALFLYITLYLQQYLGNSPLQAGVKYLPITVTTFLAAGLAGALIAHVPPRTLLVGGLGLAGVGLVLMSRVQARSHWTALLAGFLVAGVGIGVANAITGDVAMTVVPEEQGGTAAGINDMFRQVGIAIGIAAWGAIFLSRGASATTALAPAAHGHGRELVEAVSLGRAATLPAPLARAAEHGFISGFNEILILGGALALLGTLATAILMHDQVIEPAQP